MIDQPPPDAKCSLLYDGQCPMCSTFARFAETAESGQLKKIDARQDSALRTQATAADMDLDYGIVVEHQGVLHYGADAATCLAKRNHKSWQAKLLYWPFRFRWLSSLIYPVLVHIRRLLLWLGRKGLINNLRSRS
jgi:predicted DCC family thiol-disulfide oxidoreductase YuxK